MTIRTRIKKDMMSATSRRAKIERVLISGASMGKLKNAVLGFEALYCGIVSTDQVDGEILEKQVPPPCSVVSGVTQVDVRVTVICTIGSLVSIGFVGALIVAFVSN
jgi:hypothetical protein